MKPWQQTTLHSISHHWHRLHPHLIHHLLQMIHLLDLHTKPPPQEWLLEYVTSHVTKNKNSPPNNNMNQEWSMQKVICIAISIIIYIGIILWLLVSISSGDEVTISSSSKTCDIIPDGGQSNNSDNMSCSSTSVGDDVSIHRGKEIGPNIKASDVSASFLFIFQPYSICGALFLCIHISIPMHIL